MNLSTIIQRIKKSKHLLISTHENADPDAVCSELALAHYLKLLKKKFQIINNEAVPQRFRFIPGTEQIRPFHPGINVDADTVIVVDCGEKDRIGNVAALLPQDALVINIDHHITNDNFGDLNYVDPKASSTAEILYALFKQARCRLDQRLALYLYLGMMTDTGCFRYENTTARTHQIVSDLLRFGLPVSKLYGRLYETIPLNDLKAFVKIVGDFEIYDGGKVACVELPKDVLCQFSADFDLRDTIFKFLRAIKGMEVLVIFTEVSSQKTRINFRSTNRVNVAHLAHFFQGGGHRRASGCLYPASLKESKPRVLAKIKELL
ncbi:MAG: bifunctional oligoribonuclease/PAP phosphatase NrnA [Candidatus Omnitrophota bacterium]|nr:bifunctional oligoribonuclease/PAP phosphatase NrnA [Candidatus Omnitrophota bacterium]